MAHQHIIGYSIQVGSNKIRAGFRGGGKLGSCPGASTAKRPSQKTAKELLPKET